MNGDPDNEARIARLRSLASVLIPATPAMPGISDLATFDTLLQTAVRACGYTAQDIAMSLDAIPQSVDWDGAKAFAASNPRAFAIAGTLASAAYYMAPAVLAKLKFPTERQHPAEVEEFVEEYETGILDAVTERGSRFRDPDLVQSRPAEHTAP